MSNIPKYIPFKQLLAPEPMFQPITINFAIPPGGGGGTVAFKFPDHTMQLQTMGLALARCAAYLISIAEVVTLIADPKGGIRVKDALDPYQYEIVTSALEANDIQAPPPPAKQDTSVNTLGGTIAQTADLAAAAGLVAGVAGEAAELVDKIGLLPEGVGAETLLKFVPNSATAIGNIFTGATGLGIPDMTPGLRTILGSIDIIATALSIIAQTLNGVVDVPSKAMLMKSILSTFTVALNEQSIKTANREPPTPPTL